MEQYKFIKRPPSGWGELPRNEQAEREVLEFMGKMFDELRQIASEMILEAMATPKEITDILSKLHNRQSITREEREQLWEYAKRFKKGE